MAEVIKHPFPLEMDIDERIHYNNIGNLQTLLGHNTLML